MNEAEDLLSRCRSLSSRVAACVKRTVGETDALEQDYVSLTRQIEALEEKASNSKDTLEICSKARNVLRGNGPGGDLRKLKRRRSPWLLRMLLGDKCPVRTQSDDRSLALKQEYHSFRSKTGWMVAICPHILLFFLDKTSQEDYKSMQPTALIGVQIFIAWLFYMYAASALRESVLYVNGSNIRQWWIQHHMWSMFVCVILLALPTDSNAFSSFCGRWLKWSAMQGIVMLIMNRYQRRRMYTRIALGKNSAMDVVTGESSGMYGQLMLLYPMLFILQFWQIMIGIQAAFSMAPDLYPSLMASGETDLDLKGKRGVFFAGILFCWMGVMNFWNTVVTLENKRSPPKKKLR